MQSLTPLTSSDLIESVQTVIFKAEVFDGASWINLASMPSYRSDVLTGWEHRKQIDISGEYIDDTLTNFPVCVLITGDTDVGGSALSSGYDIRFTAENGVDLLKYERVSFSIAGGAATGEFWVRIPTLTSAGIKIFMYYGNAAASDGADPTAVWDSDFKAVWHMNDATTSTTLDSTSNDNDGTKKAANEPVESAGKIGKAQTHDGSDDRIDVADASELKTSIFTKTIWFNIVSSPDDTTIREVWRQDYRIVISLRNDRTTKDWEIGFHDSVPTACYWTPLRSAISVGDWHHVAVRADGTNWRVFYDGSSVANGTYNGTVRDNNTGMTFGCGYGPARWFNVITDEARVSSIARSDAWVKFEYRNMSESDNCLTIGSDETLVVNTINSMSCSVAGAGANTEPLAGSWALTIANTDGIFNPYNVSSDYATLIRLGRKVRLSWGLYHGGVSTYWQRIIGFMDTPRFDLDKQTIAISGTDYMKTLADTKLYSPYTAWGTSETFTSVATGGSGSELYDEADACEIGAGEANNTTNWAEGGSGGSVGSVASTISSYALQFTRADVGPTEQYAHNSNIVAMTAGQLYIIGFWGRITSGTNYARFIAYETVGGSPVYMDEQGISGEDWRFYQFTVTPTTSSNLQLRVSTGGKYAEADDAVQIDEISVKTYDPDTWERYDLDPSCNGIHYVTLDGEPVWHGDEDGAGGWHYENNDGVKAMFFSKDMTILAGLPVVVYYYTDTAVENVVADLLVAGGLYTSRALALAAMSYTATGVVLERCRFDPGTTALDAMRMLCERVNYRFWFAYDGTPCFKPAPVVKASPDFTFSSIGHFGGMTLYQDINEIRNHIIITGEERAVEPSVNAITPSNWLGEAEDASSIATYQEKTHQVDNYLFTDQTSIDTMCLALLDYYKLPKDYVEFSTPFCPVPLEIGDTVSILVPVNQTTSVEKSAIIRALNLQDGQSSYTCDVYESMDTHLTVNAAVFLYTSQNIVFPGGGDTTLTMFNAAFTFTAENVSMPTSLAVNNAAFGSTSSTPTLQTNTNLVVNNAAVALAVAGPTLACSITYTYTPADDGTTVYVPTGYTIAQVSCWGPGGMGGGQGEGYHGGGGGGGAYAYKSQAVTGGGRFDIFIGAGSTGASTYAAYNYSNVVLAVCGQDGSDDSGAQGGDAADCTGDTRYSGGNGYYTASGYSGGGGGSSAGTGANGNNATSSTGATAPTGGGNGGNGGPRYGDGYDGSTPGGGGGGTGDDLSNPRVPGDGGDGRMTITFTH